MTALRNSVKTTNGVFFPSGAFAWKMQNENFLKDVDWLSELKLRVSFGQTGNSNIGGNAYEYYEAGNQYVFGDAVQTGSIKSQLENPDLKWETTTELNVGLDFGFLNNRITGSFEYFHKVVSDLLAFRKLNSLMEVSTIADNIGATQSTGYEFSLNTVNLTGPFKWNTTLNISSYNDRWKERNPDVVLAPYEKRRCTYPGYLWMRIRRYSANRRNSSCLHARFIAGTNESKRPERV